MRRFTLPLIVVCIASAAPQALAKNPIPHPQPASANVFRDVAEFNIAAGLPPVSVTFDNLAAGDDIASENLCGVTFQPVNAPLIVVRAADTYTPEGFRDLPDPKPYALVASSGDQLLSPGGAKLGPGPDPAIEDDDIVLTFEPPVAAVGFDHISQLADGMSYTSVQVIDVNGNVLYDATLEIGEVFEQRSYLSHLPEAHNSTVDFWGIVSQSSNIREIRIDERDDNEVCPDSNIGIDTLRFAPSRCGTAGDLNLDGQIDSADVQLLIQQWGDYSPCSGETIRWSPADLDRNGTVNGADIIAMMRHAG